MKGESKKVDVRRIRRYVRKRKADSRVSRVFGGVKGRRRDEYLRADPMLAKVIDQVRFKDESEQLGVFERVKDDKRTSVLSDILEDSEEEDTFNLDITELDLN